jgi:hypothetical protein
MTILFFLSRGLIVVVHFVRQPRQFEHGTLRSHFTFIVRFGQDRLNRLLTFLFLQLSHLLPSEARAIGTYTHLPQEREDALLLNRSFHCDDILGAFACSLGLLSLFFAAGRKSINNVLFDSRSFERLVPGLRRGT